MSAVPSMEATTMAQQHLGKESEIAQVQDAESRVGSPVGTGWGREVSGRGYVPESLSTLQMA